MDENIRKVTHVQNIRYDKAEEALYIIDQTKLPGEEREIRLRTVEEMEEAICEAIAGGATMIQIRDKTEDFGRLASLSQPQTAWWRTPTS